ncbi:MAG: hypothetical protein WD988_01765 [Candidatus Curtissbacteria bacterium]
MLKFILVTLVFIFSFALTSPVFAQELTQKEVVTIPIDQTINQDYFATGEKIVISGTINGDAYLFGGTIIVDGVINGDLIAGGGTVKITGSISDNVRIAGGELNVSGNIGKNITAGGGSIHLEDGAKIGGSLVAGGGDVSIFSPLGKGATIGAGNLVVADTIGGNVTAGIGELSLLKDAKINGNLTYWSSKPADIPTGSIVGETTFHQAENKQKPKEVMAINWGFKTYSFLVALLIGSLLLRFLPVFTAQTANRITTRPVASLAMGLLILVTVPLIAIMIAITIVGIPISLILIFAYVISLCFAKVFAALAVGTLITKSLDKKLSPYLALIIGLLAYYILSSIPVIGFIAMGLFTLAGLGSLVWTKKEFYNSLRAKKLI